VAARGRQPEGTRFQESTRESHGRDAQPATPSSTRRINHLEASVSTTEATGQPPTNVSTAPTIDMRLEVVVLPVSDVDRAKQFYMRMGWRLDADFPGDAGFRVVQLTPPGSPCSIIFGSKITSATAGSADALMLVVTDVEAARADLLARGIDVSEIFHDAGGVFHHAGTDARVPGLDPQRRSYSSFASFNDPDGNGWILQEIVTRLPGR
jgi:catechol 2,3-dioxygenase-like lactoylglutathione lyase family enzyme